MPIWKKLHHMKNSSQVIKEDIMCPADYPYLYNKSNEKTNILIGQ